MKSFLSRTSRLNIGRRFASSAAFPSLTIRANELVPQGSFAKAQADFLSPHRQETSALDALLKEKNVGVVAHFYMDPELQGVLHGLTWPHVFIADSLAMGDHALKMVRGGVNSVLVLGVDFMTENVRATMRAEGFDTPVYRLADRFIGCSLAESAEGPTYAAWLSKASQVSNSIHIVYINTSLRTKANAHELVPTITCTSSNVVNTVLQSSAQMPGVNIWFGPDTYMGENLVRTFQYMAENLDDDQIAAIHPQHTRVTITDMLTRFNYFKQGNCVVHHMFGGHVTDTVRSQYSDAYQTAHLEVPGEMFELALEAQQRGKGIVGSTSDILNFITAEVSKAADSKEPACLPFILGTEAGMITSIVGQVQTLLKDRGADHVECEVIFPVAEDAIAVDSESPLGLVPGVSAGEGCSVGGGCATCPYMKMNNLDSLFDVLELHGQEDEAKVEELTKYKTQRYADSERTTRLGVVPINHMRSFQVSGELSLDLVQDVQTRGLGRVGMEEGSEDVPRKDMQSR